MASATAWLLDTGILLHWIRASKAAQTIDAQFHLRASISAATTPQFQIEKAICLRLTKSP